MLCEDPSFKSIHVGYIQWLSNCFELYRCTWRLWHDLHYLHVHV